MVIRRRHVLALLAGLFTLLPAASEARKPGWRRRRRWRPPPGGWKRRLRVHLESPSGRRLRTVFHRGQTFVVGETGERYVIVLRNPTRRRLEAVVSVDGLDAVNGRPSSLRHRGYVIPPFGTVRIEGFRTSLNSVATFRFTSPHNSYAGRKGRPHRVGNIAVSFFEERSRPAVAGRARPSSRSKAAKRRPRASASARRWRGERGGDLGTEFGESRISRVDTVRFVRASSRPARVVRLRYDSRDGLLARGILGSDPITPRSSSRFAQPPPR